MARHSPRIPLGLWLAGLTAAATAIVVGAAFALLHARVSATTRGLIADQVTQGQQTLIALRGQANQQFLAAAALLANSPSLRSAMATARVEREQYGAGRDELELTVRRELERLAPDLRRDLVATTDESGRVFAVHAVVPRVARVPDRPVPGLRLGDLPAVRNALDASLDADATDLYHSTLHVGSTWYHVAAAPIVLDGFTIGTALLGDRLDEAYLRDLQKTIGGELVITSGDSVVASTFPPDAQIPALDASARGPHAEQLGGMEYMGADLAIGPTDTGAPVRLHLLQAVTPVLDEATEALLAQFVLWGLLAVVAAGFGTALVAQRVLHPLDRFVRDLRRGEADAAAAPAARPAASVEIRWLNVSFARLMRSLARKRAQLEHQAWHDPLTGLPNRLRFRAEVNAALAARRHGAGEVAVLFLDLDHFKTVNDALGHAVGDELLVEVARRLQQAVPSSSTVARLGGDEFAVLLRDLQSGGDCAHEVEEILRAMRLPVTLTRAEVLVGASVGVAGAACGATADELLRNADVAMYRAKQQGRGRHEVFTPDMHAAVVERLELEADLRRALSDPDTHLQLVYQPIVALDGERIAGLEALVRWAHPTRGVLAPSAFIPLAEATGLVIPLGRWVLRAACVQAASWQRGAGAAGESDGEGAPYVSVNLSGRQLEDDGLVNDVRDILAASGLEPARLLLEITESVLMQRADASLAVMQELKALGVRLAIDDFGTGYSSLAYLQRFPVDVLKIDKAFVDGVAERGPERALARGIVGLAASLGLRCIAEGIEHEAQATQLRALGCGYGQGYFFARPLAADRAASLVTAGAGYVTPTGAGIRAAAR